VEDDSHAAAEAQRLFAAALREARLRYGHETGQGSLTQKEFARMLGISGDRPEERYRLYESGKREPPLWILAALRRVTGYSLDDLIAQLPAGRRLERDAPSDPRPKRRPAA
jgi:transcriptional regulator with XRE-family HTH domain